MAGEKEMTMYTMQVILAIVGVLGFLYFGATAMANDSIRYRHIYDSVAITATSTGTFSLFTSSASKTEIRMHPFIDGRLPVGERMSVERLAISLGTLLEVNDSQDAVLLNASFIKFFVDDGEGDPLKIQGLSRVFPSGAGPMGQGLTTSDLALTSIAWTNGVPDRRAMFLFPVPIIIKEGRTFRVELNIPAAITALTDVQFYVSLEGPYKYRLAG